MSRADHGPTGVDCFLFMNQQTHTFHFPAQRCSHQDWRGTLNMSFQFVSMHEHARIHTCVYMYVGVHMNSKARGQRSALSIIPRRLTTLGFERKPFTCDSETRCLLDIELQIASCLPVHSPRIIRVDCQCWVSNSCLMLCDKHL